MMVWLFDLSLLLIEQECYCYSPSLFYVLTGVFVLLGYLWVIYFFRICSLFRMISFTRWITWSSSLCSLMVTVFNICVDWWWNWSLFLFYKLLFASTAQSQASLQYYGVFISSVTAENSSFLQVLLYSLISSGKRIKASTSVLFLPALK